MKNVHSTEYCPKFMNAEISTVRLATSEQYHAEWATAPTRYKLLLNRYKLVILLFVQMFIFKILY